MNKLRPTVVISSDGVCHALSQAAGDEREIPQDVKELAPRLEELLGPAAQGRPVVLILDAVNKLDATDNAHSLYWLPRRLPPNVRVIASSLEHPALEAVRRRGEELQELALPLFDESDAAQIIATFLSRYRKQMDEGALSMDAEAAGGRSGLPRC
jgi:hypothetical protein